MAGSFLERERSSSDADGKRTERAAAQGSPTRGGARIRANAKIPVSMSAITTHVLDTARGRPAGGVRVSLEQVDGKDQWARVGQGVTDTDGRLRTLMPESARPVPGLYRLLFDTRDYYAHLGIDAFFPFVTVTFEVADGADHYHLPLLLSPFGYTTYRGS
jgi:5-hydroxyisourate hydrolase